MATRDTRQNFLKLLDDTWPGVRSEFVAAMRQARAGGYPDGLGGLCHILAGEGEQMTYKGNDHGTY